MLISHADLIWQTKPNNSLNASGGSAFLNLLGAAEGALVRAAASTQPLDRSARSVRPCYPVIELSRSASSATLDEGYDWRNYVENACGAGYSPEWTF